MQSPAPPPAPTPVLALGTGPAWPHPLCHGHAAFLGALGRAWDVHWPHRFSLAATSLPTSHTEEGNLLPLPPPPPPL